eukprot:m.9405 g.9405  ORF g.9405 m.9405 type:complete len:407 (+) comp2970_c0_seq1:150-1370(+)
MADSEGGDEFPPEKDAKRKLSLRQKLSKSFSRTSSDSAVTGRPKMTRRASSSALTTATLPSSTGAVPRPAFGTVDTYKKLEKLGEGTYATVFKGISHVNGKMVALKEIRLEHEEGAPCTAIREVSLLKTLRHANIVTLHDIIHTKTALTLVFEYLEKDLKKYMDDCGSFIDMSNVRLFLFQLLRGLQFCHSRKVLHRDLKPQNILINQAGELKLADFGLARAKSVPIKTYSNEVVTLWYRPPDVLLGSVEYSTPIDMWGVGCIFAEMVSGHSLFPGSTIEDELLHIWKVMGTPDGDSWPGLLSLPDYTPGKWPVYAPQDITAYVPRLERSGVELLKSFLKFDPRERLSAETAMKHKYFACYGPEATKLSPTMSVFSVPTVVFKRDVQLRRGGQGKKDKLRRSSVRF